MPNVTLQLDKLKVCHKDYIPPQNCGSTTSNVFVGLGLWSKTHSITKTIPIDILLMIVAGDKLRQQINPNSTLFIYVADNLAIDAIEERDEDAVLKLKEAIKEQCHKTKTMVRNVLVNLKIKNAVVEDSNALNKDIYLNYKKEISKQYHDLNLSGLEASSVQYIINQTALIQYYHKEKNCAYKVSWCYDPSRIKLKPDEITKEQDCKKILFDELWFDAYYLLLNATESAIGFIYTHSGRAVHGPDGNKTAFPPYYAGEPHLFPRISFNDTVEEIREKLQYDIKIKDDIKSYHYRFIPTFKNLTLLLLFALKDYQLELVSKVYESNSEKLFKDLVNIAQLGTCLTVVPYAANPFTLFTESAGFANKAKALDHLETPNSSIEKRT